MVLEIQYNVLVFTPVCKIEGIINALPQNTVIVAFSPTIV